MRSWTRGMAVRRKLRGVVDLATGRYPRFIFGGSTRGILPVFHFHEVEPDLLEQQLSFLRQHGYRTVTSAAIERFVVAGEDPPPGSVVLAFDDAWSSLWTVAYPLLKRYDLNAITYAIPARIRDTSSVRPTIDDDPAAWEGGDSGPEPFVTRGELERMHRDGVVDVQSHTFSHAMVPTSGRISAFLSPQTRPPSILALPIVTEAEGTRFLDIGELGSPLLPAHSRMSDARRFIEDPEVRHRCIQYVAEHGGQAFFQRAGWERELRRVAGPRSTGRLETEAERERDILRDLIEARRTLGEWLNTDGVRHLCFPWGVAGATARALARTAGYRTAFADRRFGYRAVRRGEDPFSLMRLPNRYIFRLPAKERRRLVYPILPGR